MRSSATTERGISSSRKPTTRIGNASSVNNAIACTSSPGDTAPVDTRQPPTASSAMIARFGSASRVGSKSARSAPTATRADAQLVGRVAQPLHLGVLAPERLHDHCAFEALVRDRRHVADPLLHRLRGQLDPARVEAVQREHRREQHETDQREQRIDREERDEREDDQQHEAGRERQRVDHLRRDHHVVVGVGEQRSGRVLAVERQRNVEVAVGDLVAQRRHVGRGRLAREVPPGDHAGTADERNDDDRDRAGPDRAARDVALERRDDDVIGDAPEHDGAQHRR